MRAVEFAEWYADGRVSAEALDAARSDALFECGDLARPFSAVACAAYHAAGDPGGPFWWCAALAVKHAADCAQDLADEMKAQADLLRDVFAPVVVGPALLSRDGVVVRRLAEAAYLERSFLTGTLDSEILGPLGDAVEEAGGGAELVAHLRSSGPHVRGCAVIDALTKRR
jgi:hypothetical protein